ncbi:hypothetical protein B4168_3070 [Anoxybacillus flavithermus]|nr:hypothetical protein B4168_3070 [Anoxybacillus flavithermus]OAO86357.1 hypothetical protein GT23_2250 [Parageobacillus thermoglucosidasius]
MGKINRPINLSLFFKKKGKLLLALFFSFFYNIIKSEFF